VTDPSELDQALHRAVASGDVELAVELVEAGAPVSYMDIYFAVARGWTPLVAAMVKTTTWTLGSVFTLDPPLDIARILVETGRVELDEALAGCVTGRREVAELLVRSGAHPGAMINGANCLHHAIARGDVETFEWLISLGVPEEPTSGESLMHLARTVEMIRFLARRGHPIDEVDTYGQTPLHRVASLMGSEECDELVRLGADRSRRDAQGHTYNDLLRLAFEAETSKPH
jgi:ankyrin repeat protein